MSTASSPSDPSASEDLPNATSLEIIVVEPPGTSYNPTSDIYSISNTGESENDSDDSSSDHSPLQPQLQENAHVSLSEGTTSSSSNPPYPSSITGPNAEPFVRVEDPVGGNDYMEIMFDLHEPLASDSEEAQNVTSAEDESS
ncbi:hypothetical protein Dimus_030665, partial [Dionaea muscipula]